MSEREKESVREREREREEDRNILYIKRKDNGEQRATEGSEIISTRG